MRKSHRSKAAAKMRLFSRWSIKIFSRRKGAHKKLWESVRKERVCVRKKRVWVSASEKSCTKVAFFFQKIFVKKVSNLKNKKTDLKCMWQRGFLDWNRRHGCKMSSQSSKKTSSGNNRKKKGLNDSATCSATKPLLGNKSNAAQSSKTNKTQQKNNGTAESAETQGKYFGGPLKAPPVNLWA